MKTRNKHFIETRDYVLNTFDKLSDIIVVRATNPFDYITGSGTEESPYLIRNEDEWNYASLIPKKAGVYFKLMANLDFTGKTFYPYGNPNAHFKSNFDGNGYKISNASISGTDHVGIFGYNEGNIYDLDLENISVSGRNYVGTVSSYNTGSIVGMNIKNVSVTGNQYVGGVAGDRKSVV